MSYPSKQTVSGPVQGTPTFNLGGNGVGSRKCVRRYFLNSMQSSGYNGPTGLTWAPHSVRRIITAIWLEVDCKKPHNSNEKGLRLPSIFKKHHSALHYLLNKARTIKPFLVIWRDQFILYLPPVRHNSKTSTHDAFLRRRIQTRFAMIQKMECLVKCCAITYLPAQVTTGRPLGLLVVFVQTV